VAEAVRNRRKSAAPIAASLPVAQVALDVSLPHLDRLFDYLVPEPLADLAVPGCRVRARFAGRLTSGFLLHRAERSEHAGRLARLERVVSPEVVLSAGLAGLARAVADHYGGTLADVLRLAIPPRHAGAEAVATMTRPARQPPPSPGPWARYTAGPSFLAALAGGRSPRAVWPALPGPGWPEEIARAVAATVSSGRGALAVVPDAADLALLDAALRDLLGAGQHVCLAADLGPAERYRRWLAVSRGQVRVVAGTRSAMFAPVDRLGLVAIWDDGDDLHAEPRAPYPHAREVLLQRAHRERAAALVGGYSCTPEAAQLVARGWARLLGASRAMVRREAPLVRAADEDAELARDPAARTARLPGLALRTARQALPSGPVLVQVPRRGYIVALACERCRARARCPRCGGPLALPGAAEVARCLWCRAEGGRSCERCGHNRFRALVTGSSRTAEELGRAFPSVPVISSTGGAVIPAVSADPAVVVATPGAEPRAPAGYAAAVLLDGWALLGRPSLRAAEEALRRWMNAAALVRPAHRGGSVVVTAEAGLPAVQALVRWDPMTHAERELADRRELRFPPAARMAALTGGTGPVADLLAACRLPDAAEILGPVPVNEDQVRALIRVPRGEGRALAAALREAQSVRSAAKRPGPVRVQLDPAELI
jgi:primosomal protein N' (replication factor Y)